MERPDEYYPDIDPDDVLLMAYGIFTFFQMYYFSLLNAWIQSMGWVWNGNGWRGWAGLLVDFVSVPGLAFAFYIKRDRTDDREECGLVVHTYIHVGFYIYISMGGVWACGLWALW